MRVPFGLSGVPGAAGGPLTHVNATSSCTILNDATNNRSRGMQSLPDGRARLIMVEPILDPLRSRTVVFVRYQTLRGERSLVVSPERAEALGLYEAYTGQQPVPVPTA
jgi:hypothetical protein